MRRMKCEFESTGVLGGVNTTFFLTAIFSFSTFFAALPYFSIVSGVSFIIFLVSLPAAIITSALRGGVIYAFESKIMIIHRFFNKRVFVSSIRFSDIKHADYNVEASYSRIGFIGYNITLTITEKTENEVKITAAMDIDEHMPTEKPDEYKKHLSEQPLVKMCRFINERARKF